MIDAQLLKLKDKQSADRAARELIQKGGEAGGNGGTTSSSAFQGALSRFYKK